MLELTNISKSFNGRQVLSGVSLSIADGEVYGLIGANGAGKTTLMNIISRIIAEDRGEVRINGRAVQKPRDIIGEVGYMLDIPAMFEFMNATEFFSYLASPRHYGAQELADRSAELLDLVGLTGVGNKPIKSYSRGMKQRMGIAAGLINDPKLVLMDEPTSALDPQGRYDVVNIIKKLAESGRTVVLSTHILSDVEKVCDRIGILSLGRIKVEGAISDVMARYNKPVYDVQPKNSEDLAALFGILQKLPIGEVCKRNASFVRMQIPNTDEALKQLFSAVAESGIAVQRFENLATSLEEIFMQEAKS